MSFLLATVTLTVMLWTKPTLIWRSHSAERTGSIQCDKVHREKYCKLTQKKNSLKPHYNTRCTSGSSDQDKNGAKSGITSADLLVGVRWLNYTLVAFSVLMLLARCHKEHPACKHWVIRCWCGYLSGARWALFAYGPADATASQNPTISCFL